MKWLKPLPVPAVVGNRRKKRCFAVFPIRDSQGIMIWLEPFIRVQEYKAFTCLAPGIPVTSHDWFTVEVEHLCSFPRTVQGGYSPDGPCLCGKEREVG